jgi:tRNA pseudouridine55 synthase
MSFPSGFLIVDKPTGVTSFSIVALVRRLTGVRRVGHAGTLDPLASGVLPVAVGQATRLIEYTDDAQKRYIATVRFGITTDTYDADGTVTAEHPASRLTRADIEAALPTFIGHIEQRPPAFSALKLAGRPLYSYARSGEAVEPAARTVRIDSITITAFDSPDATLDVRCGKGAYVRSLAHDLGQSLGTGAHLTALRRAESASFTLAEAHTPDALRDAHASGALESLLLAPDRAVERRPAAILEYESARRLGQGKDISIDARFEADLCRAYSFGGGFLGILERGPEGAWHPRKMLVRP